MTQHELNQKIANQTGESVQTIALMGFSPLQLFVPHDEWRKPLVVDWDELDIDRYEQRGRI